MLSVAKRTISYLSQNNLYKRAKGWSDFYDIRPIGTVKIGSIYYKIDPATHTAVTTYQEYQSSANYQYMKAAIVPETFMWAGEEYTVVGIGESSFDRCYDITHFDIPNTVTVIEKDGFYIIVSDEGNVKVRF